MTITVNNVPQLRFPGFSGEWEEKRLGDITSKIGSGSTPRGGNKAYISSGIPFIRSQNVVNGQLNIFDTVFISEETHKKMSNSAIRPGDVLLNITGASLGRTCVVPEDFDQGNLSQHVCIVRIDTTVSNYLVHTLISTQKGLHELLKTQTGGGKEGLNFQAVRAFRIVLPEKDEQEKIAGFLTAVDGKIAAMQRKKELLEKYKKGVMQKIFSQELRFKDNNGQNYTRWQKKNLKAICDKFMVPMRDKPKNLSGPTPWCRIEDFDGKYLMCSKSKQGVDHDEIIRVGLTVFPKNTLIVSCSANLGECAIAGVDLVTNQTFIGLSVNNENSLDFMYHLMRHSKHRLNTLSSGTTISYLSRQGFEKFIVEVPSIKEQKKIADFLTSIDEKIEAEERKLEQAKQFKKALLQQMFV